MSSEKYNFNKITKFITDSYNEIPNRGAIIVKSVKNGFVVNDILVKKTDIGFTIIRKNTTLANFNHKRIAILFAALSSKKRYWDSRKMVAFDRQYNIFNEDKTRYNIILSKRNNPIIANKLSRTETELDLLEQQLQELEKSLSLQ